MKGISPLVAAVLLIGITMTIAGALAFWVSGFMSERVGGFGEEAKRVEKCSAANFVIEPYSTYNNTTKTLTIYLTNKANVQLAIKEIDIMLVNGTIDKRGRNETLPIGGSWLQIRLENVDECKTYRIVTECAEVFREGSC